MTQTKEESVWEVLEDCPKECEAVADLCHWSYNYDFPSPFTLFLDIIGYTEEQWGEPAFNMEMVSARIGFLEAKKLGKALCEYADNPQYINEYIDRIFECEDA